MSSEINTSEKSLMQRNFKSVANKGETNRRWYCENPELLDIYLNETKLSDDSKELYDYDKYVTPEILNVLYDSENSLRERKVQDTNTIIKNYISHQLQNRELPPSTQPE
jgi:phenolic acid decarboxylase